MKRVICKFIQYISLFAFCFFLLLGHAFAQEQESKIKGQRRESKHFGLSTNYSRLKSSGDTIWYENFDSIRWSQYGLGQGPEGWQFIDSTGNDYYWGWSKHGPRGRYLSPNGGEALKEDLEPSFREIERLNENGASCNNGFMQIEMDYFNTNEYGEMDYNYLQMNSYFQTTVDLSAYQNVNITFKNYWRLCCAGFSDRKFIFAVSSDYDPEHPENTHWLEFNCWGLYGAISDPTHQFDISQYFNLNVFAGQNEVTLRWYIVDYSHYYWIIDDILLYEPTSVDLELIDANTSFYYIDYADSWRTYKYQPVSLTKELSHVYYIIRNLGGNKITDGNVSVSIDNFIGETIYRKDSLNIQINACELIYRFDLGTSFTPQKMTDYNITYSISANEDININDNVISSSKKFFTSKLLSHSHSSIFNEFTSTNNLLPESKDGYAILSYFLSRDLNFENIIIDSLSVFIGPNREYISGIMDGKFKIKAVLYEDSDFSTNDLIKVAESELITLDISDTMSYVFIPFNEQIELTPDIWKYFPGIEFYTGNDSTSIEIGSFSGGEYFNNSYLYFTNDSIWAGHYFRKYTGENVSPAIDVFVKPPFSEVEFIVDMHVQIENGNFIQETDELKLIINESANLQYVLSDGNNDSIFNVKTNNIVLGDSIMFNFIINNEIEEGSIRELYIDELKESYSCIFDNNTSLINISENKYQIFPNPAKDVFTISPTYKNTRVKIYNILGKEFSINPIHSGSELKINISHLPNGIYFIKINNEIHKIVIN
jgi:Secretion system C-terminal sorting domain